MTNKANTLSVVLNPWQKLKDFTDARIALGRAGSSIPTNEMLKFQLEHAQARDAVHLPLNAKALYENLEHNLNACPQAPDLFVSDAPLLVSSCANDRGTYLQRPDLGRKLNQQSCDTLSQAKGQFDLAICVVDGLSSMAIEKNTQPFLQQLLTILAPNQLSLAPLVICTQGRVAIGDHVAQLLGAKTVIVLIGERPGLLSPDSMGLYLTFGAHVGCNDAQRNCISNIRPAGLRYESAVVKAKYLLEESQRLGLSGVNLKERSEEVGGILTSHQSFLTQAK
ncbi:ethanolamine ammonia-lyase subunit EutC [Pseudomonas sp. HK3]